MAGGEFCPTQSRRRWSIWARKRGGSQAMPAYLIVYREGPVRDQAEMDEYHSYTRQMSGADFKLTPLAAYGAVHALEGTPPEAVIMLQFPTVEDAKAWYGNPIY